MLGGLHFREQPAGWVEASGLFSWESEKVRKCHVHMCTCLLFLRGGSGGGTVLVMGLLVVVDLSRANASALSPPSFVPTQMPTPMPTWLVILGVLFAETSPMPTPMPTWLRPEHITLIVGVPFHFCIMGPHAAVSRSTSKKVLQHWAHTNGVVSPAEGVLLQPPRCHHRCQPRCQHRRRHQNRVAWHTISKDHDANTDANRDANTSANTAVESGRGQEGEGQERKGQGLSISQTHCRSSVTCWQEGEGQEGQEQVRNAAF